MHIILENVSVYFVETIVKSPLEEKWMGENLFQKVHVHLLALYKQIKLAPSLCNCWISFVIRKLISAGIFTLITLHVLIARRSGRTFLGAFPGDILRSFIMKCTAREWLRVTTVLFMARAIPAMVVPNATLLDKLLEKYMDEDGEWWMAKQRGKRAITDNDMQSILDLHNKLRSQVYPAASNMEYMVRKIFKWYVHRNV